MKLEGDDSLKSYLGTMCSVLMMMITAVYAYMKLVILIHKKDTNILSVTSDLYFTDDDVFRYSDGLNIAVAFTAYDSEREWILDKSYGEILFNEYKWGTDADGNPFTARNRLETHQCTREELNLEGDPANAKFYPLHPSSEYYVDFFYKKFLCVDSKDLEIYGDFNTFKARQLNI